MNGQLNAITSPSEASEFLAGDYPHDSVICADVQTIEAAVVAVMMERFPDFDTIDSSEIGVEVISALLHLLAKR